MSLKNTGKKIPVKTLADIKSKLENDEKTESGSGIGLKNVHQRIKELFGPAYGLEIKSGKGTEIKIILPIVKQEQSNNA